MEPFSMLQLLLSENQFELIFPETDNATLARPPGLPDE